MLEEFINAISVSPLYTTIYSTDQLSYVIFHKTWLQY